MSHCRSLNDCLTNESASVCPQTISCPAHSCDILVDDNTVMWVSALTCFYFFDGSSHWLALIKRRAWPVFAVWLTNWRRQEEFLTYCKRQSVAVIVAGCCEASVHHTGMLFCIEVLFKVGPCVDLWMLSLYNVDVQPLSNVYLLIESMENNLLCQLLSWL